MRKKDWSEIVFLVLSVPFLLFAASVGLILIGVSYPFVYFHVRRLKHQFWERHSKHGRFALFVYSDSPNWKDYIETNILPHIQKSVVTLNWSKRREWEKMNPFEAKIYHHWAGDREHNPIAIIFLPSGKVKEIRFWQAFRDFKHGKDRKLKLAEQMLFEEIERCRTFS